MIFLNNLLGGGGGGGNAGNIPGQSTGTDNGNGNYSTFDYVNGGLRVSIPKTEFIHGENFNTSGAVVIYTSPAGETTDVTSAATFEPSNGSAWTQDGQNTVRVSYAAPGKDTVYASQLVNVLAVPDYLTITLADNGMRVNEGVSYKGAKVIATMTDMTEKDVSNSPDLTWSPLEGTIQDRLGNFTITATYTENTVSAQGSVLMDVTDHLLRSIKMTLGKKEFFYGQDFSLENTVVKATYDDDQEIDVTSRCQFLPEKGSKLETHGNQTVTCTYVENSVTKTDSDIIKVKPTPLDLTVKFSDSGFRVGATLDYGRATVTCRYSDGSTGDVTSLVTWSPSAGTVLSSSGSQTVRATYATNEFSLSGEATISVTNLKVTALGASIPNTSYREGDQLNLGGATATAMYEDGSTKDVSASVNWSPSDGSTLGRSNTRIKASYSENSENVSCEVPITVTHANAIQINGLGDRHYKEGDALDLSGATVTATYTDGSSEDVTAYVQWSPSDGSQVRRDSKTVTATYSVGNTKLTAHANITVVYVTKLNFTMSKTKYNAGDSIDLSGAKVEAVYSDGSTKNVTNEASFSPSSGAKLNYGDNEVQASYGGMTGKCSISVTDVPKSIKLTFGGGGGSSSSSSSSSGSSSYDYNVGDSFSVNDCSVALTYASGNVVDLNPSDSHLSWRPANGSQFQKEGTQVIVVSYSG